MEAGERSKLNHWRTFWGQQSVFCLLDYKLSGLGREGKQTTTTVTKPKEKHSFRIFTKNLKMILTSFS